MSKPPYDMRKGEPMNDSIYRQDAIDALDKRFDSIPMEQTTEILLLRKDLREMPSASLNCSEFPNNSDAISRQDAIEAVCTEIMKITDYPPTMAYEIAEKAVEHLPSAQPELPPYVAEIEAEYQKAVKMPHIYKPLAKALYEVWKKHDREDAERRTDG